MSVGLSMPHDRASAEDVMKFFNDKAYSRNLKPIFQEAVDILYRSRVFEVQEDNSGRMLFSCKLCNSDMNSHESVKLHHLSGKHLKNYDKKAQEEGIEIISERVVRSHRQYAPGSIQHRLMNSQGNPVGVEMLEEYQNRGKSYYKCILCGAHGRLDAMYKHATGTKHTEKYIKAKLELESSILSANERDQLAKHLVAKYGINVDFVKIIRGNDYYPHKWEAEGKSSAMKNEKNKKQQKRMKRSPSPYSRHGSPDLKSRRRRSPSPTSSHYSRGRSSQSPQPSTSRSKYSESPPRRRHRERHDSSDSSHRNRSPPRGGGPHTPPMPSRSRARTPPPPPPPYLNSVQTMNRETQKVDLEELMIMLNFLVKSQNNHDSDIKSEEDLDQAIRMMWNISLGLFYINKNQRESEDHPANVRHTLEEQAELIQKILGFQKNYMIPEAGLTLEDDKLKKKERVRHKSHTY